MRIPHRGHTYTLRCDFENGGLSLCSLHTGTQTHSKRVAAMDKKYGFCSRDARASAERKCCAKPRTLTTDKPPPKRFSFTLQNLSLLSSNGSIFNPLHSTRNAPYHPSTSLYPFYSDYPHSLPLTFFPSSFSSLCFLSTRFDLPLA
ncbi:hypothetical protein KQX54_006544 [Cotesia glomerata]|uniref:Uncharacterized protein n=1 Tax=Cotesia glomerata TaxID=32391 RepID=A0AAV7IT47_COTGL|nr:hypothetical protein KQX54_006544 [Cotesia glomerata]